MVVPLQPKAGNASEVALAIELVPAHGWHTYWQNPGDAGSPTTVDWKLPKDWKVKSLVFPVPDRIVTTGGIVCYGYDKPATLIATLTPPPGFKPGFAVPIQGNVKWLTCTDEVCKPASGAFQTLIKVPAPTTTSWPAADLYAHPAPDWKASASLRGKSIDLKIVTPGSPLAQPGAPYFFSSDAAVLAHDKPQDFSFSAGRITAQLPVSPYANHAPKRLRGVLRAPAGMKWSNGFSSISLDVPIS
jgi:thiol:disulfide interchange protein DsbD